MHIAFRICNNFLLLFFYLIIVLYVRIFWTSEDVSWWVLLLCFVIKCYFMGLFNILWVYLTFYGAIFMKVISKMIK